MDLDISLPEASEAELSQMVFEGLIQKAIMGHLMDELSLHTRKDVGPEQKIAALQYHEDWADLLKKAKWKIENIAE